MRGPLSKRILDEHGFSKAEIIGDPALFFGDVKIKRKKKNKVLGINIGTSFGNSWGK